MKLNNDRLNAFYQVAIDKSFSQAADSLCITQSALSQRVLKLEQEVGTHLIIRSPDGISLTEQGKTLFEYISDQQAREQDVLNKVTGRSAIANGIIRIGAFSSVMRSVVMPSLIPLINSPHQLKVEFFSRELRNLPSLLLSGEVDFIITDSVLDDSRVQSELIGHETLVHIRNKTLAHHFTPPIFLDHDVHDVTTFNFFEAQGMSDYEFDRNFYDDVYGLIDGVRLGFGEAIVSKHMIKEDDVFEIIDYPKVVTSPVMLCCLKTRYLSELQQQVIEHLKRNVPKHL
ncbi:LysR family transcriptional regulator [Alteromonas facilis]|uniref:LysR family transcriptional regulator n=1 Tax=Alteromonas facilis TaxID=2048004 RepID=UPI000F5C5466|nr:LysR family transcriptional regulator [Alteromonas facilis]